MHQAKYRMDQKSGSPLILVLCSLLICVHYLFINIEDGGFKDLIIFVIKLTMHYTVAYSVPNTVAYIK